MTPGPLTQLRATDSPRLEKRESDAFDYQEPTCGSSPLLAFRLEPYGSKDGSTRGLLEVLVRLHPLQSDPRIGCYYSRSSPPFIALPGCYLSLQPDRSAGRRHPDLKAASTAAVRSSALLSSRALS